MSTVFILETDIRAFLGNSADITLYHAMIDNATAVDGPGRVSIFLNELKGIF